MTNDVPALLRRHPGHEHPANQLTVPATPPWSIEHPRGTRPDQASIVVAPDKIIDRQGKQFVLYSGLLDAAHKAGLHSIITTLVQAPNEHNGQCAIIHASAEFSWGTFCGIGDADPVNTSRGIAPHRIRMAETRAKARALRDALNVSMVAVEEMGPDPPHGAEPQGQPGKAAASLATVVLTEDPQLQVPPRAAQVRQIQAMAASLKEQLPKLRTETEAQEVIDDMTQRLQQRQAETDRRGGNGPY